MLKKKLQGKNSSSIESFQAQDVYDYLQQLKHYGHRGRTSYEICAKFAGIFSESTILKQLARLQKGKYIKKKSGKVTLYEAI
jgi:hypothetical protein